MDEIRPGPAISVVVVNWNRKSLLRECLRSLARQADADFEVILVDNGSEDGSADIVGPSTLQDPTYHNSKGTA